MSGTAETKGIAAYVPGGDLVIVLGVRLENNQGLNYGRNHIYLTVAGSEERMIASEGNGYVAPPVSAAFESLKDRIARILADALTSNTIADMRMLFPPPSDQGNPITIIDGRQ